MNTQRSTNKEVYESVEMEVVLFETPDIIRTSADTETDFDDWINNP